ncbi:lipopolysaccharide assembly protein LapA domain-containing protein [uncultured Methylobacterium sp.]|uniref:lipopolysaccharide assembly protein LapA domain-containing protein n=1 Tax=uncultured Methylobacterium sp. TaxID=157278 RepID=UPI0035C9DCD3
MIRFLKGLVLLPVTIAVILLAVANRDPVRLSLDPFSPETPVFSLTLPLYAILFGAVALGIVVGGIFAWLGQGRARRQVRHRGREIRRLEGETARLKAYAPPEPGTPGAMPNRTALPVPR